MQFTDCTSLSEELIQRIHDVDSSLINCFFFFFFFGGGGGGGGGGIGRVGGGQHFVPEKCWL